MERKLMKINEVAAILGLGRSKTYELVASGTIPSVRLGPRVVRVPQDALDAWLRANTGGPDLTL
jgi:excisionase family DNA binding protein